MSSTTIQAPGERPALSTLVKVLLGCGIISSLFYVGADVFASMSWAGYSYANQAVSELMALGAPTRSMMLPLMGVYNVLAIAFAAGVWQAAGNKRGLRVAAVALVVYAIVGQVTQTFSPMNPRGSVATATDVGHIILTAVEVLSIVAFVAFGSGASGKGFRIFSILTIVALMAAGVTAGVQAQHMTAAAASTPWTGIIERVNIYGTMLWVLVLAVALLPARMGEAAVRRAATPAIAARGISIISITPVR